MTSPPPPAPKATRESAGAPGAVSSLSALASEPSTTLPAGRLLLLMTAFALIIAGAWSAAFALGRWGAVEFRSGMFGIGVTAVMALLGLLVMTPWKARPMADWMTMWLAGTVFRLLGTPTVLFLLYSAASAGDPEGGALLAVKPMVLSVALTYLVMVLAEASIIASHVRRLLPSP